jgi:hypothetical protein
MARGKKTGGRNFKPGHKFGNPKGACLPPDIKGLRAFNKFELERMINACIYLTEDELKEMLDNGQTGAMQKLVAKILYMAIKNGDIWRANFILERIIGKVPNAPLTEAETLMLPEAKKPEKKSFTEFCIASSYFEPFPKQIEMVEFALSDDVVRLLLGARGYGKTDYCTIMGVAYDLYSAWFDKLDLDLKTNLIITKSKSRNAAIINEISTALEKNGVPLDKSNSTVIRLEGLIGQDHSVEAITIKTSMRGRHPKRIILDDPVTDEDTSEAMRVLVKKKYDEAFKLCKNILVIGQPAHAYDLYSELRDIVKKLEVPHGSIPQLDSDLEAMKLAGVDQNSIEMSYHLRIPQNGSSIFSNIKYCDAFPTGDSVAFIDPSEGNDFTAVSIVKGYLAGVAVEGHQWKKAWYHCLDDIVAVFKKANVKKVCFETNKHGDQPLTQLRQSFSAAGLQAGVVGKFTTSDKHADIVSAGSYSHLIHLSKTSMRSYTDHVVKYEYGSKNDDAPDSLARCLIWLGLLKGTR